MPEASQVELPADAAIEEDTSLAFTGAAWCRSAVRRPAAGLHRIVPRLMPAMLHCREAPRSGQNLRQSCGAEPKLPSSTHDR
jgi:hypothetical protein